MCNSNDCMCKSKTTPALKLEVGKTYVTNNGTKVKIVHKSLLLKETSLYLGVYEVSGGFETSDWFHHGGLRASGGKSLVSEYKEPEYWYVNIYPDSTKDYCTGTTRHNKLEEANGVPCHPLLTRIALVRINRETGVAENVSI